MKQIKSRWLPVEIFPDKWIIEEINSIHPRWLFGFHNHESAEVYTTLSEKDRIITDAMRLIAMYDRGVFECFTNPERDRLFEQVAKLIADNKLTYEK